jgi:hypothetical protein
MLAARRTHLFCAAALGLGAILWLCSSLALPDVPAESNRLQSLHQGLIEGQVSAEEAPVLAQLLIRDASVDLEKRLAWLGVSVPSRLRHAVRIPARAEEDPQALLALMMTPELEAEALAACPKIPAGLAVICDAEAWGELRAQILSSFEKVVSTQPEFAAAARVGGNDVSLSAADALCRMGNEGQALAEKAIQSGDPAAQSLGVLALGCAGGRAGVGRSLREAMELPGGAGLAATLECAVAPDCQIPPGPSESDSPQAALQAYAFRLQEASP